MRYNLFALLLGTLLFLGTPSAYAQNDSPKEAPPPRGEKLTDSKKDSDNGLGNLFSGLAEQSLKVFMNPDLLKQVPGNTKEEKTENVKVLLNMIEGDSLPEKLEVIRALKKLKSDPALPKPPEEVKRKVKDWYPILEQFAGKDGYVNHADVSPIMDSIYDGTIRKVVGDLLPRLAARRQGLGRKPILADQEPMIRDAGKTKLHKLLDNLGVPEETERADASPERRDIWARVFDQITEDGQISVPKALDFYQALSKLPPPPVINDKVLFKKGLPVKKLEPLIMEGKIPKDLRISLEKKTGKIVIQ